MFGLLEAYWDAYEAVELNTYADLSYLEEVWDYHARIVDAVCEGKYSEGKRLLEDHMELIKIRGISLQAGLDEVTVAT